jgi:Rrf2 family protein
MVQLARLWPRGFVQARDLAQPERGQPSTRKLPHKFLEAILLELRKGRFLESKVGSGGGYRLARPPRDIRVGELIRRLEGRLSAKDGRPTEEMSPGEVAVHLLNDKLTKATDEVLDNTTLEQLLEQVNRATSLQQQQMYYI